jgi:hypothetical protein
MHPDACRTKLSQIGRCAEHHAHACRSFRVALETPPCRCACDYDVSQIADSRRVEGWHRKGCWTRMVPVKALERPPHPDTSGPSAQFPEFHGRYPLLARTRDVPSTQTTRFGKSSPWGAKLGFEGFCHRLGFQLCQYQPQPLEPSLYELQPTPWLWRTKSKTMGWAHVMVGRCPHSVFVQARFDPVSGPSDPSGHLAASHTRCRRIRSLPGRLKATIHLGAAEVRQS